MMRGLVAQVESECFGILDRTGLEIDGALGEPVALSHVSDQDALGARSGLELAGEIVNQLDPLLRIFARKQDKDGGEAGKAMCARVLARAVLTDLSTRTGTVTGRSRRWLRSRPAGRRPCDAEAAQSVGQQRAHVLARRFDFLRIDAVALRCGCV